MREPNSSIRSICERTPLQLENAYSLGKSPQLQEIASGPPFFSAPPDIIRPPTIALRRRSRPTPDPLLPRVVGVHAFNETRHAGDRPVTVALLELRS
jgi:hypothetical protein